MNILHILSQYEVTGAETFAIALANEQVRAGHNVLIVSDNLHLKTEAMVLLRPIGKRDYFQRCKNISTLKTIIREQKIDVVHAHSRAASWISFFATRLGPVPLVSTLHGRQHVHFSSKLFSVYGEKILAVCEGIRLHFTMELRFSPDLVTVVRNGIDLTQWMDSSEVATAPKPNCISIVGRLSGPKGDLVKKIVVEVLPKVFQSFPQLEVRIVGGMCSRSELTQVVSLANAKLKLERIKQSGFVENVKEVYRSSSLVIGSGRVAMEALATGTPVIGVGESNYVGLISNSTKQDAIETNFGDAGEKSRVDWNRMAADIGSTLRDRHGYDSQWARNFISSLYNIKKISIEVSTVYGEAQALKKGLREIPVLMYHHVTDTPPSDTKHGIYVTCHEFNGQLSFLKRNGFTTLTFNNVRQILHGKRTIPEKPVILTFDDGYEDNYVHAFPLLKKYAFNGVVFVVGNNSIRNNTWDLASGEPEAKLLTLSQIVEMQAGGIEFGAHSMNHKKLTQITLEDAQTEIRDSKSELEDRLGMPVISFAYPYGLVNGALKRMIVDAGYSFGIASDSGPRNFWKDPFEVRRIQIFPRTSSFSFWKKSSGWYHWYRRIP